MSLSYIRRTLSPIGERKDGSPIFSYFGAEGDDGGGDDGGANGDGDDGGDGDSGDEDDDRNVGDDGLNEKGRKAIQAERAAAKRAQDRLRPFAQLRKETGLSIEEMRERLIGNKGSGSTKTKEKGDDQVDPDEIRREARREAQQKSDERYIKMAVKAEASSVLNDPDDANRYLDFSSYEVDEDGEVDPRQIKRDLKALIEDRPYLAKKQKSPDFEGGSRGTGAGKGSMSETIRRAAGVIR